jgi:hypothetical protein
VQPRVEVAGNERAQSLTKKKRRGCSCFKFCRVTEAISDVACWDLEGRDLRLLRRGSVFSPRGMLAPNLFNMPMRKISGKIIGMSEMP